MSLMSPSAKDSGGAADIDEQDKAIGYGQLPFRRPYSSERVARGTLQSCQLYGTLLAT
ncbi:MAG: hypothetical protein ABW178_11590 [Pseudoxanthomonas sp.]